MFGDMMRRLPPVHVYGTPLPKDVSNVPISAPVPLNDPSSSPESLRPAIDGPPSPERIRAYTESMRRSSIFGNNSRTGTFSSGSSEHGTLSRKSSTRSTSSNMPSNVSDKRESVQIFGSIFTRNGRKLKRETSTGSISPISMNGVVIEEESAKEYYFGKGNNQRIRKKISSPKNFQHITHTRHEQLPDLHRTSRMDLVSEFSAIRDSQAPSHGELKGIRAQDLHFENFSSEALSSPNGEPLSPATRSPRERMVTKRIPPPPSLRPIGVTKSHDNLRMAPPRPPRSPLNPPCPVALPARTSSRTASVLFDQFDPLATTSLERPYANGAFRHPSPFGIPVTSNGRNLENRQSNPMEKTTTHSEVTPGDEAWPLTAPLLGQFAQELKDVKEEEEEVVFRASRASVELRVSQSVPGLRRRSQEQANTRPETLTRFSSNDTTVQIKSPISDTFQLPDDSWEADIDWCYEHEVEADCDFQWDQYPEEHTHVGTAADKPADPPLKLAVQNDERAYKGKFRPSLLVPSSYDIPELSPMSTFSTVSPDPRTPGFTRPMHLRSPSHASSFKESHGFNLSPSLLIPGDFQTQMDHESIYQEQYVQDSASGTIMMHNHMKHPFSPIDENESSTSSYPSSNFSRGSARSSSSTRISSATSRASQDSMHLSRAEHLSQAHRSIGSASSLPDLIHSMNIQQPVHTSELSSNSVTQNVSGENLLDSAPAPGIAGSAPALASLQHRRRKSLVLEQGLRTLVAAAASSINLNEFEIDSSSVPTILSPVPELPVLEIANNIAVHGRKISAPVSPNFKEFKGRARSSTTSGGRARVNYALFPQI